MIKPFRVSDLPSVPLSGCSDLPYCPAVYLAVAADGEVLYIGRSVSLATRWKGHHRKFELDQIGEVRIAWLSGDSQTLLSLERELIAHFEPRLNRAPVVVPEGQMIVRHIRMPRGLDEWLRKRAGELGYRSVAQLVVQIVREAMNREKALQAA